MRAAFSSAARPTAVLQRGMHKRGARLVVLEGSAELPGDTGGQREAQRTEPALSRAG
jgi:hypothetical protein